MAGRSALLVVVAVVALVGCGGDDDNEAATTAEAPPPPTAVEPTETEGAEAPTVTEPEPEPAPTETEVPTSPEDQPGGAGDEEPAQSLALFTGENGRIMPRVVRVPAFISIRVELRSGDGKQYGLTFAGETIKVSRGLGSVSSTIDGLRPGQRIVGTPTGASNRVRIEATAEPGP